VRGGRSPTLRVIVSGDFPNAKKRTDCANMSAGSRRDIALSGRDACNRRRERIMGE
jgi:hypothetical protein